MTKKLDNFGGSQIPNNPIQFGKWLAGEIPSPLVVEVSPTHGCNHNCVHCSYQQYDKYDKKHAFLQFKLFKNFTNDFSTMGGKEIYFAGKGEPLLNPDTPKMIIVAKSKKLNVSMSTNGALFSPPIMQEILPHLKAIKFSINGGNPEIHSKIHRCPQSDFNKIINNIQAALEWKKRNGLKCRIIIHFVILPINLLSASQIITLHKTLGTDELILRPAITDKSSNGQNSYETMEFLQKIKNSSDITIRAEGITPQKNSWSECNGIYFRTNLDNEGNLFTCPYHFYTDCNYGNINHHSFKTIWYSQNKENIFQKVISGGSTKPCKQWCSCLFDNLFLDHTKNN